MTVSKYWNVPFAIVCVSLMMIVTFPSIGRSDDNMTPPILQLKKVMPSPAVFKNFSAKNPIVIKSTEEAAKYFDKKNAAILAERVDFEKQIVLIFAWRGSGQDRLSYSVAESYPEQVFFKYKRGLTRDLRPHVYIYALRNNVTWNYQKAKSKFPL